MSPTLRVTAVTRSLTVAVALACLASVTAGAQAPAPASASTAASAAPSAGQAPSVNPAPSDGHALAAPEGTWVVTGLDAFGEGLRAPRREGSLTVSWLPAGRLEGESPCGTYVGSYTIEGHRLRMGSSAPGSSPADVARKTRPSR